MLLEKGVTVNTVTQAGDTPLHLAVRRGDFHSCKLLLEYGADICLPNAVSIGLDRISLIFFFSIPISELTVTVYHSYIFFILNR